MSIIVQTYGLFNGASLLSFLMSALWVAVLAVRGKPLGETCKLALLASHILFGSACVLLLVLLFTEGSHRPVGSLVYSLVALAALPCVSAYLREDQPRYRLTCIALTCLFASAMVFRAWQTL